MSRARLFKPKFFANAKLSEIAPHGRLLFVSLWTLADRKGRLKDEPRVIKGITFPFENVPVEKYLAQLADGGFIKRYEVAGERYIEVVHFEKHQRPHQNEPASELPPMYEATSTIGDPSTIGTSSGSNSSSSSGIEEPKAVDGDGGDAPPAHPFALAFSKEFQQRNAGRRPMPTQHAEAIALEDEHGADWCFRAAQAFDWQKPPSYLRPWIVDHKEKANGKSNGNDGRESAASANTGGVADGVSNLDRLRAAVAARERGG